jgi:hypothetical protein
MGFFPIRLGPMFAPGYVRVGFGGINAAGRGDAAG